MAEETERSLSRFDPFRELGLFEPWPGTPRLASVMDEFFGARPRDRVVAPVDITESDGEYVISVEVAGVKKNDLVVEVQDRVLSVRGEKRSEREEKKEKGRLLERTYGAFSRSFTLPRDADADAVRASFEDGVLKLTLPKKPEVKAKSVAIKG
jgi:HSP20 family protein